MGGITGIPNKVLNIDPPKPPETRQDLGYGESDSPSNRSHIIKAARYQRELRSYNAKQTSAAVQYDNLCASDPTQYVQTLDKDLSSGKIRQEYYDSQCRSGQRRTHRDTYYKQQEAKAKRERELAEQQAALRKSQEKARKAAQQQRTLQGLESVDETSGEVVAVSGGGASETEEARGRRRRGGRLSAVLGL